MGAHLLMHQGNDPFLGNALGKVLSREQLEIQVLAE